MKTRMLSLLMLCLTLQAFTEQENPFPDLKELQIEYPGVHFYYDATKAKVVNKPFGKLDKSHPLYDQGNKSSTLLAEMPVEGETHYFIFWPGDSEDPTFIVTSKTAWDNTIHEDNSIGALRFFVRGDGTCYSDGHINNFFNERRKWKVANGAFHEVEQPFYYVDIKAKTQQTLELLDEIDGKEVIAKLPKGYEVEVLIASNKSQTQWLLVRTPFGLVGWVKRDDCNMPPDCAIDKIYFRGD